MKSVNSFDASLPPEASLKGGGHGRRISTSPYVCTPFLPTPTHFPSFPSHSHTPSPYLPIVHVAFPSYSYPQHYSDNLLNKFLISHPFNMAKPSQGAPVHPFHHTTPHPTFTPSLATSLINTRCSAHPIYSPPHAPLR